MALQRKLGVGVVGSGGGLGLYSGKLSGDPHLLTVLEPKSSMVT